MAHTVVVEERSLYRVSDAALLLNISVDTLRRLEKQGRIPPAKRDWQGQRVYSKYDIAGIDRFREGLLPAYSQDPEAWDN